MTSFNPLKVPPMLEGRRLHASSAGTHGSREYPADTGLAAWPSLDHPREDGDTTQRATSLDRIFENLIESKGGLQALFGHAFDVVWKARATAAGTEGTVWLLWDVDPRAGSTRLEVPKTMPLEAWWPLLHPNDIEPTKRALERAAQTGEDFRVEYRTLGSDGTVTWFEGFGTAVEFNGETPRVLVGAARNITRLRQVESDLSQARHQLRDIGQPGGEGLCPIQDLDVRAEWAEIIGKSSALVGVLEQVRRVSSTNSVVLITGETGTGKDLIARAIHAGSARRDRPLVTVNCAALPPTLVESELFGHEKGAFTGAVSRRVGRFELAHRGTIFLDEIGDLPAELQAKLLRVLQTGEFERVGSCESKRVDVRVIAATNTDLGDAVQKGTFRSDLFFRLNVFPIKVPALRDRRDDIPLLVTYLAEKKGQEMRRPIEFIPSAVIEQLTAYDWPGNVRELENIIERALILSRGPALSLDGVFAAIVPKTPVGVKQPTARPVDSGAPFRSLQEVEHDEIIRVCEACHWKIKGRGAAAERLGLNPSTLYFRMKKLGIVLPSSLRHSNGARPS